MTFGGERGFWGSGPARAADPAAGIGILAERARFWGHKESTRGDGGDRSPHSPRPTPPQPLSRRSLAHSLRPPRLKSDPCSSGHDPSRLLCRCGPGPPRLPPPRRRAPPTWPQEPTLGITWRRRPPRPPIRARGAAPLRRAAQSQAARVPGTAHSALALRLKGPGKRLRLPPSGAGGAETSGLAENLRPLLLPG
jgi:hypothetical protein